MPTGGSIQEVSVGGRIFSVAADADTSRKLGGFEAALAMNGNGSARKLLTRVGWAITGLTLSLDHDQGDHEYLQSIVDGTSDAVGADGYASITVTYADNNTYQGRGTVTEGLESSSMNATVAVAFGGPGKLEKQ